MLTRLLRNVRQHLARVAFGLAVGMYGVTAFADVQIGSFIYAASNKAADGLAKFDSTSFRLLKTIPLPNATSPYVLGVDPTQTFVYVEREAPFDTPAGKRTVDVVSTQTDTIARSFDLPLPNGYTGRLGSLQFTPDGSKAFLLLTDNNSVLMLSGDLTRQLAIINSGGTVPFWAAISPDGAWLYVSNWGGVGAIGVINTSSGVLQGSHNLRLGTPYLSDGAPQRVLVSPDGQTVYVSLWGPGSSGYSGELLALQPNAAHNNFNLLKHLFFPSTIGTAVQLTADGKKLYIKNQNVSANDLYIVATDSYAVTTKSLPSLSENANTQLTRDGNRIIVGQPFIGNPSASILSIDPASDIITARADWRPSGANLYADRTSFALVNVKDPSCR